MGKQERPKPLPEWAERITALRERLGISQGEFAKRLECSAMTISRWERGFVAPSTQNYIHLGKLSDKAGAWFFWELAGLQKADVARTLNFAKTASGPLAAAGLDQARAGSGQATALVSLPVLRAVAGTPGTYGNRKLSLDRIPAESMMGAPADWCPNPEYTSLIRVRGHSMEPVIRQGDILAVDSFQNDPGHLIAKIVLATHERNGLCVSHLRRYQRLHVLESEDRSYEPVILAKNSGWRIVARVLWWISPAP
ncbi:MAG TPA: XRE family transcriptional regulator [Acidobacteriaceae bacterium]|jgi:transcriptional regulator with XRE-family HTH domain